MRALLLGALLVTAGCLGSDTVELDACQPPELVTFGPVPGQGVIQHAPGETVPLLTWVTNPTDTGANVTLRANGSDLLDPEAPTARPSEKAWELEPNETGFAAIHLEQPTTTVQATLTDGQPCEGTPTTSHTAELAEPTETERGEGGRGVLVHTVGWWTNGSSFYTNLDRYHDDPDTPKGYGDDHGGGDPLPVYVYNESSEEMPPRYERAGYVTTIPGFNEALKGIPTTGARLTYLEPEQAYTRPGYEDHSLYGDALIFYIEATDVTTVPCEVPEPVCDVPRAPEPPEEPASHG